MTSPPRTIPPGKPGVGPSLGTRPTPPGYLRDHAPMVAVVGLLAVLARIPFLTLPPGNDEGGFLVVARQWAEYRHGQSLYGHYWVDRPPLLIHVFLLADRLGGLIALRGLGLALVFVSIVLAGLVAHLVHGPTASRRAVRRGVIGASLLAAVFLTQPGFGTQQVNGELIATPVILAGFALVLAAARTTDLRRCGALLAGSGACAAGAVLIKQNEIDVVVLVVLAAATVLRSTPLGPWRAAVAASGGAFVTTLAVVWDAAARGTHPNALWNAMVTFRFDASRVIASSPSGANADRLSGLIHALVVSGLPFLVVAWLLRAGRRRGPGALDLRLAVAAVLAWEGVSVAAGGSYWHHYLICLVPGAVLAHASWSATPPRGRRVPWPGAALAYVIVAALVMLTTAYAGLGSRTVDPTAGWLNDRAHRHDTLVVAYGHPEYLYLTGMRSPYPELWSLPVRVRDSQLRQLRDVLASGRRPDWIVTGSSGSLSGTNLDARTVEPLLHAYYREVGYIGDRRIYLLANESRPPRS